MTESDREIEERIRTYHIGGGQPAVTHLIAETSPAKSPTAPETSKMIRPGTV